MTALTFRETLSRVITSCGATSSATVCMLTFTILSMRGTSRTSPGPLPCPPGFKIALVLRPRRKMTARSYSQDARKGADEKERHQEGDDKQQRVHRDHATP